MFTFKKPEAKVPRIAQLSETAILQMPYTSLPILPQQQIKTVDGP